MQVIKVFYESLKIAWNYSKNQLNCSDIIFFCFQEFFNKFSWKQKDGKSKLHKQKYWEDILKQYAREPILKGKE